MLKSCVLAWMCQGYSSYCSCKTSKPYPYYSWYLILKQFSIEIEYSIEPWQTLNVSWLVEWMNNITFNISDFSTNENSLLHVLHQSPGNVTTIYFIMTGNSVHKWISDIRIKTVCDNGLPIKPRDWHLEFLNESLWRNFLFVTCGCWNAMWAPTCLIDSEWYQTPSYPFCTGFTSR